MIFVCVGSRDYQFDRLIMEIDDLAKNELKDCKIFAQIGSSTYIPKNIEYKRYLSKEEFDDYQKKASLIISHAGTGALVNAIKMGKKVISVPRRKTFGEHIDDHQLQISTALSNEKYLLEVIEIKDLLSKIHEIKNNFTPKPFKKESNVVNIIKTFLLTN